MTWRCSLCKHLQRTFGRERDVWLHIYAVHKRRKEEARPIKVVVETDEDGRAKIRA